MFPKKIMIVGLGLMGASLAASCKKKFPKAEIVSVSRDAKAISHAKQKKWIHQGGSSFSSLMEGVDLIVMCTPIDVMPKLLKVFDSKLDRPVVVTDVGSVKGSLEQKLNKLKLKKIRFIGAHPMVGSHERGALSADPKLYDKGLTFITENKRFLKEQQSIEKFWKKITGQIIVLSAKEHDQIVANISHLPHLIASCLIQSLPNPLLKHVSSGFKDTTRVAAGHESVWLPIFLENKKAVSTVIRDFQKELKGFENLLKNENHRELQKYLKKSRLQRQKI